MQKRCYFYHYTVAFQGLQDIVFDNQTSLSLVSNGVEVIMINKKFFTEQLNTAQFVRLREKVIINVITDL